MNSDKDAVLCETKQLSASSSMSSLTVDSVNITDIEKQCYSPTKWESGARETTRYEVEREDPQEPIPSKTSSRFVRFIRWNFFSTYRRLFTVVFVANCIALIILGSSRGGHVGLTYSNTVGATSINLLVSILCRQEHVVNMLFRMTASIPITAPFQVRRWCAEVYHYGGLHSGCGVAAVFWYLAFASLVTRRIFIESHVDRAIVVITYLILSLLTAMCASAYPSIRHRIHNLFEAMHRFAGWTVVILFWTQVLLTVRQTCQATGVPYGRGAITNLSFWCLCIITVCIVYPWARMRRRDVEAERLSEHAIRLHFKSPNTSFCQALRLSENPLKENHAFAAIPSESSNGGFSVVISNAGDWTKKIIQSPPKKLYIKGVPTFGVLRLATMFEPVLLVATGSGIAPLLSLFAGAPGLKCRVLWSTPSPVETFSQEIVDRVLRADPNAVIIDTRRSGRPNIVEVTYRLFKSSGAEAVVVISNPTVTKKLVYGMETRGVPAYAPIFDS